MRKCIRCKRRRPEDQFAIKHRKSGRIYRKSYCRPCWNAYLVERRKRDPEARKKHNAAVQRRKRELAEEVQHYKTEHPCVDCGYHWNPWQMQFDHPPGVTKVGDVAQLVYGGSPTKLWEEIEKCELVCANCHADRTHFRKHGAVAQ